MDRLVFDKFSRIAYEQAGIVLKPGKESLVSARIAKRMKACNITTHKEYLRFLQNDKSGNEMIFFLDAISTNLTSFYRENDHFIFFRKKLDEWISQDQRKFRVWCAAASTGEEPYSIAMTMLEAEGRKSLDMRILATDISTKVLGQCIEGKYTYDKMKDVPKEYQQKYFNCTGSGDNKIFEAKATMKKMILFKRLNLMDVPYPMKGPLDVIFCRNVMIYFDHAGMKKFINEAWRLLKPGGYLFVGHSESLSAIPTKLRRVSPAIYIKET